MNFMQAFSETLGKEQPAAAAPTQPTQQTQTDTTRTGFDEDMKAYIDAKFEALKSDLLADMTQSGPKDKVETPEETDNILRPEEQQAQESLNNTIDNK